MAVLVHLLHTVGSDSILDELVELLLERLLVVVLQRAHVVGHVLSEDVVAVHVSAEAAALVIVTWEALCAATKQETYLPLLATHSQRIHE